MHSCHNDSACTLFQNNHDNQKSRLSAYCRAGNPTNHQQPKEYCTACLWLTALKPTFVHSMKILVCSLSCLYVCYHFATQYIVNMFVTKQWSCFVVNHFLFGQGCSHSSHCSPNSKLSHYLFWFFYCKHQFLNKTNMKTCVKTWLEDALFSVVTVWKCPWSSCKQAAVSCYQVFYLWLDNVYLCLLVTVNLLNINLPSFSKSTLMNPDFLCLCGWCC